MVKYYDPAIYGDDPIEPNGCGYEGRLYVTEEDYAALEARVSEQEKDAARYRWIKGSAIEVVIRLGSERISLHDFDDDSTFDGFIDVAPLFRK